MERVRERAGRDAGASADLPSILPALRQRTERRLVELVPDPGPAGSRAQAAMHYALLSPGRRLRAKLTLLTARCLGAEAGALDPACALEMVHAASLVMDDLPCMDDTAERRGRPATHVVFGEPVALLATIGLVNAAYATLAGAAGLEPATRIAMVSSLTAAVGLAGLVVGQERDLAGAAVSPAGLAEIHQRKTGVLFTAAVELGGLAADAEAGDMAALRGFAREFGLAFQALDDLEDSRQDGGTSAVAVLGLAGTGREVERRLAAARAALAPASARLQGLLPAVDALLGRSSGGSPA